MQDNQLKHKVQCTKWIKKQEERLLCITTIVTTHAIMEAITIYMILVTIRLVVTIIAERVSHLH